MGEKILFSVYYFKSVIRLFLYRLFLIDKKNSLSSVEKEVVKEIIKNGYCVIEDYWDKSICADLKGKLESKTKLNINKDFTSGAYIRVKDVNKNYDKGVTRMYHADKEEPALKKFRFDESIARIARAYYGYPVFSSYLAFQSNKQSECGTRGYHVDGWVDEFKAFLYLEDVSVENGPFAYLKGSNHAYLKRFKRMLHKFEGKEPSTSFSTKEAGEYAKSEKILSGKAGTLILADVAGFHRGLPQKGKNRSILFNNYYSKDVEMFFEK